MNSGPRWLISMTHIPVPCQSSISADAWRRTSSGSTAGPALKLKTLPKTVPFYRAQSFTPVDPAPRTPLRQPSMNARGYGILAIPPRRHLALLAVAVRAAAVPAVFLRRLGDLLDRGELGSRVEVDQADALRRTPHLADLGHGRADQHAPRRHEHDLVVLVHQDGAHGLAVALGRLDRDHALGAPAIAGILGDRRALAESVLGRGQHALRLVVGGPQRARAAPTRGR